MQLRDCWYQFYFFNKSLCLRYICKSFVIRIVRLILSSGGHPRVLLVIYTRLTLDLHMPRQQEKVVELLIVRGGMMGGDFLEIFRSVMTRAQIVVDSIQCWAVTNENLGH